MKEMKLTLNDMEFEYLKSLLILNEEVLLNRLECRVDIEDNNIDKLNLNRSLQNKIYVLISENSEKEGSNKKKLGLNCCEEEEKPKTEGIGIVEVLEIFEENGVDIDDMIEYMQQYDFFDSVEEYAETLVEGLVDLQGLTLKDKDKTIADMAEILHANIDASNDAMEDLEECEEEEEEEEHSPQPLGVNFFTLIDKASYGYDLKDIFTDEELDYMDSPEAIKEVLNSIIEEAEMETGLTYKQNDKEMKVLVEVTTQLVNGEYEVIHHDQTLPEGTYVYLKKNLDNPDATTLLGEICQVVGECESNEYLLTSVTYGATGVAKREELKQL